MLNREHVQRSASNLLIPLVVLITAVEFVCHHDTTLLLKALRLLLCLSVESEPSRALADERDL